MIDEEFVYGTEVKHSDEDFDIEDSQEINYENATSDEFIGLNDED